MSKHKDISTVVTRHDEELKSMNERLAKLEAFHTADLEKAGEMCSTNNSLAEMEEYYKEQLRQERSAHKETEEEFKSFKDRVAGDVELALKTGNSENMNNPVNETRLKEMYEELTKHWAKVKPHLQAAHTNLEEIKAWIKEQFRKAAEEMENRKKQIESVFTLNTDSTRASQKVHDYTKLSIQNLQLAVYYSWKDTAAQKGETPDDALKDLSSKCTCLSSLLALNNPPLHPDWENHHPGLDSWNIFPQDFRAASAM